MLFDLIHLVCSILCCSYQRIAAWPLYLLLVFHSVVPFLNLFPFFIVLICLTNHCLIHLSHHLLFPVDPMVDDGESDEQVVLVSQSGTVNRIKVKDISIQSRYAR